MQVSLGIASLNSFGRIAVHELQAVDGVGDGPLGCLDCRSSQVSLLSGATPDEVP